MTALAQAAVDRFVEQHEALQPAGGSADWAAALRERGRVAFETRGFPGRRDEDWKYTDLRALLKRKFASTRGDAGVEPGRARLPSVDGLVARPLVLIDGIPTGLPTRMPDGLTIVPLATALAGPAPARLEKALGALDATDAQPFAALNTAMLRDGLWIDVAPNCDAGEPLLLNFFNRRTETALAVHPRIVVTAGRDARLTLIEHISGEPGAAGLYNAVTQIHLDDGAAVVHYRLQEEPDTAFHVAGTHVFQGRDSRYVSHNVQLGAALARNDIHVSLDQPAASVLLNGFYMTAGRQHCDNHTRVEHRVPHTASEETYRGVLAGRSRAVFNGKAVVHPGAMKTDARQSNRNLLLSPSAEIDTKPELEIYADDVRCSHGATIGQLDENAMFYLLSRGIDRQTARSLLTFAFADEVIARLGIDALRRYVEQRAAARMPDSDTIRELV